MKPRRWFSIVLAGALLAGCGSSSSTGPGAAPPEPSGGETPSAGAGEETTPAGEEAASGAGVVSSEGPSKGTSVKESRSIEMEFDLTLLKEGSPAGMQSGSWSVYEERTLEVLSTKDKAVDKLKISFGRREAKPLLGVEKPSVTAGKTYFVENGSVKSPAGKDVPAKELGAVKAEYGWVGSPSPLAALLSGMSTGSKLKPPADARRALIGELPGIDHDKTELELELVGVDRGDRPSARVQVTMTSELDGGDMDFTLTLKGPAVIDTRTGWVASVALSGTVKAKGTVKHKKQGRLESRGKGKVEIERKAEFF